eukprot:3245781-Pyramimonas_sp.AAC.1
MCGIDCEGGRLDCWDGDFKSGRFRSFDAYMDDTNVSAIGPRKSVLKAIAEMVQVLFFAVTQMIGGKVAMDKVALICSCPKLGAELESCLGPLGPLSI